jgi:hypothetical protein
MGCQVKAAPDFLVYPVWQVEVRLDSRQLTR